MLGRVFSEVTRTKMSESHGGVLVHVFNAGLSQIEAFPTQAMAAAALGCSARTLKRWAEQPSVV